MTPRVSVVIPTHARETRLAFALDALAGQTLDRELFEVLVVRNHASPRPFAEPPDGLPVRFVTSERSGPAAQRNRGWEHATAPLVAFMDDDCRPSRDWLRSLSVAADAAGDGAATVFQGRTEPDPDELHLLFGLARSMEVTGPDENYPTCNMAYPRALLERLGGFDEAYSMPWAEDTDLGLRARELGTRFLYVDEALVWHAVHARRLPRALREALRREHMPRLLARHPEHRRMLRGGIFLNDAHAALTCALVGAVVGMRMKRGGATVATAAALPYVGLALTHFAKGGPVTPRRLARLAVHLPVQACVDLVETLATVRGAVTHRVLVV